MRMSTDTTFNSLLADLPMEIQNQILTYTFQMTDIQKNLRLAFRNAEKEQCRLIHLQRTDAYPRLVQRNKVTHITFHHLSRAINSARSYRVTTAPETIRYENLFIDKLTDAMLDNNMQYRRVYVTFNFLRMSMIRYSDMIDVLNDSKRRLTVQYAKRNVTPILPTIQDVIPMSPIVTRKIRKASNLCYDVIGDTEGVMNMKRIRLF